MKEKIPKNTSPNPRPMSACLLTKKLKPKQNGNAFRLDSHQKNQREIVGAMPFKQFVTLMSIQSRF